MQLLVLLLAGLFLGVWLHTQFGLSALWTLFLALAGFVLGIIALYHKTLYHDAVRKHPPPKRSGTGPRRPPPNPDDDDEPDDDF